MKSHRHQSRWTKCVYKCRDTQQNHWQSPVTWTGEKWGCADLNQRHLSHLDHSSLSDRLASELTVSDIDLICHHMLWRWAWSQQRQDPSNITYTKTSESCKCNRSGSSRFILVEVAGGVQSSWERVGWRRAKLCPRTRLAPKNNDHHLRWILWQ